MNGCETNLLSAFVDGELDAAARARVAAHLESCPACAQEVSELRSLAASLSALHVEPMKPIERARLHKRLDDSIAEEEVDAPIWRFGGAVGLIAASILVVAGTWLAVLPASSSQPKYGQNLTGVATATLEPWEQVARTGFVPVPMVGDQVYLADNHFDEYMVSALNGSQP